MCHFTKWQISPSNAMVTIYWLMWMKVYIEIAILFAILVQHYANINGSTSPVFPLLTRRYCDVGRSNVVMQVGSALALRLL